MTLVNKNDLMHNYDWKDHGEDAPEVSGDPDATRFDREDGGQVLDMINGFAAECNLSWKTSGLLIENLLRESLPACDLCQSEVMDWLKTKWDHFK